MIFPTEVAIAFTGLVHFSNNIFKFFLVGKNINKKVLIRFGLHQLAALIGSYLLVLIDDNIVIFSYYFFDKKIDVILVKFLIFYFADNFCNY